MERSCWYHKPDIFCSSKKNLSASDISSKSSKIYEGPNRRIRSKSTSSSTTNDDLINANTTGTNNRVFYPNSEIRPISISLQEKRSTLRQTASAMDIDCDITSKRKRRRSSSNSHNADTDKRNLLRSLPGVPDSEALFRGKWELLNIWTPINTSRVFETINAFLLASVFLLGALSAIFLTVCYKNGDFGGGPSRTAVFQPFPQTEHLQVIDESYLGDIHPPYLDEEDNECDGENKLALELEAVSSLRSALEMKDQGKYTKSQKLFKHALALCPRHPDLLTYYGEFFEDTRRDYMMADHLYVQALAYSPRHTKALINRKRTLPVVEELDEKRMKRIDAKRDQLLQLSETNRALRRIRKEAYFQHIYHSAGIEGNTMSLQQTRLIVETRMAVGGKSVLEHNEILGLDAALRYINTSLVNRVGKVTLKDILMIHKHVMGFVDPGEAGMLRTTQVFVGNHVPPSPEKLYEEMTQLIDWLNSEEALQLHPVHYAAIAHYKLVYVHPFTDGNGRTSRLLMNWILMQANYPPVIIRKQDRQFYYDHINTANKGDLRPFIRFIGDCTEKTMDVYLWATQERYPILELGEESGHGITLDSEDI